ncbi:MAG: carboxymuconolactone decarboxylase family protein [Nitrospirales bacterium]|nr:carboxymuconolactone decarboxylase family protein [Nitrospirales bacterium]
MKFHAGRAREAGVDEQEIQEAIEVGKSIRTGSATRMDQFLSRMFTT